MTAAIIAEFNPLHLGHKSLISQAKAHAQACIVIMSGNFTQRGSPALLDKFTRAEMALLAGADLVLELPFMTACSAAPDFAEGAVRLAALSGLADTLAFGMEDTNSDLAALIRAENSEAFTLSLKHELSLGASFPKAYALALETVVPGSEAFISKPNNMLALSYVREISTNNYMLRTLKVQRTGSVSSRSIRENTALNSHMMPDFSLRLINSALAHGRLAHENKLWPLLQSTLNRSSPKQLRELRGIDEGIEHRILKLWPKAQSLEDFIGLCVCSRYTRSQIRRKLINILLAVRKSEPPQDNSFRVLAMNSQGQKLLKGKSQFITRFSELNDELSLRASRLWELCTDAPDFMREFCPPVIM